MKRWSIWLSFLLIVALIAGCSNASNYVKDNYSLIDVEGAGKSVAKIYLAEGKTVPEVAEELARAEKPQEISRKSDEQMFLVYDNRIINVHKDPENAANTLIEIDSIEYARTHYDSSFLQGYLTGALLQSLFGSDWWDHSGKYGKQTPTYKGYGSSGIPTDTKATLPNSVDDNKPSTSARTGSFNSKGSESSTGKIGSFTTGKSSSSSSIRKNDGSTPTYKMPKTSKRIGSFSRRR